MTRKITLMCTLTLVSLMLIAVAGKAQQTTTGQTTDKKGMQSTGSTMKAADREFVMKAAEGGKKEVATAEMAVGKASNADVKNYAQKLADDHSKANQELMGLASSKGINLPTDSSDSSSSSNSNQKSEMKDHSMQKKGGSDHLANLSGADFDKAYIKDMIKDHKKDIEMFEKEASKGQDAEIKAFAGNQLPTLREHLKMAQDIAGKIGVTDTAMKDK